MNDMDLLALLRDDVPAGPVSDRAQNLFYAGLHDPEAGAPAGRSARKAGRAPRRAAGWRWRVATAGALALALGAGADAGATLWHPGSHATSGRGVTVQLLADRAAKAAAAEPDVAPGQWVYTKALDVRIVSNANQVMTGWTTADDSVWAYYLDGKFLRTPWNPLFVPVAVSKSGKETIVGTAVPYSALAKAPSSPAALDRYILSFEPKGLYRSADNWAIYNTITEMLTQYVMPPRVTAELYRAIALIPGVRVVPHTTDVAGRPGTGFALYVGDHMTTEIVLSSSSYRFLGLQYLYSNAPRAGMAVLSQQFVSGPGVRP